MTEKIPLCGDDEKISTVTKLRLAVEFASMAITIVDVCERSLRDGGKLMFCGNGGSAADSQHLATEM